MSGIAGFINIEKASDSLLTDMIGSIKYTKSDCTDKWYDDFVAIARVHHGIVNPETQPIFNEDKSLCIFMAGEVFDYESEKQSLVKGGHHFKLENNDAEYCIHLYEELGKKAFEKLNGSFLIVLYDRDSHKLLIVNDRFSSYPLFYYANKGMLLFGTQLHPLLKFDELPRRLNLQAVFDFFTFTRVLGTNTYYEDIKVLPPATVLCYYEGNISFTPYWEMKYKEEKHPERYYVNKLAKALKKSVARRTHGSHRLGILLSGGLDSRTILAASDKQMAFTYGNSEEQEVKIAKRIAKTKGCEHIFLEPSFDHFVNLLDKAVEIGDGMYCFRHAWVIGFFDQIRENCDILLHGLFFDTFFKGFDIPIKKITMCGKSVDIPFLEESPKSFTQFVSLIMENSLYNKSKQLFVRSYSTSLKNSLLTSLNMLFVSESKIRYLIRYFDKFIFPSAFNDRLYLFGLTLRQYTNERTISFDNDLFNLYLETPVRLRLNGRIFKKAIKRIDPNIASIPNANTGFSPFMPELLEWGILIGRGVIRNIKQKFHLSPNMAYQTPWPNYPEMIRHNDKLKKLIQETIEDPKCLDPLYFDIKRIKQMFKEHLSGNENYTEILFLLLTFGKWYEKYGPHAKNCVSELN
jgi:asparagine synthase (glutamine-hydrolysing)